MSAEENFFTEIVKCEVHLFFGEMIFSLSKSLLVRLFFRLLINSNVSVQCNKEYEWKTFRKMLIESLYLKMLW